MTNSVRRPALRAAPRQGPRRVVALGGGTGLPAVLRGLRAFVNGGDIGALTAVVAMTDDGGSSGRLRRTMGVPPPGDVRNCLVALSEEEGVLADLFQHRYGGTEELGGHNVGNLILAALAEQAGSFLKAVELSSRVLRTAGRILPVTLEDVILEAVLEDGSRLLGESKIARSTRKIRRVLLRPSTAAPTPGVVEAILDADLVVLGPGSLYTSIVPNLVVEAVGEALRSTGAPVILVANLVSEKGESAGLSLTDHVTVIEEHGGGGIVDAVIVHEGRIDEGTLARYRSEGAFPLAWPDGRPRGDLRVFKRSLLGQGPKLRHDSVLTAEALVAAWLALSGSVAAEAVE
jgi:uncharacterized cofD-like protein